MLDARQPSHDGAAGADRGTQTRRETVSTQRSLIADEPAPLRRLPLSKASCWQGVDPIAFTTERPIQSGPLFRGARSSTQRPRMVVVTSATRNELAHVESPSDLVRTGAWDDACLPRPRRPVSPRSLVAPRPRSPPQHTTRVVPDASRSAFRSAGPVVVRRGIVTPSSSCCTPTETLTPSRRCLFGQVLARE